VATRPLLLASSFSFLKILDFRYSILGRLPDYSRCILAILETQMAKFGPLYTPPYILLQAEDLRKEIAELEEKLKAL